MHSIKTYREHLNNILKILQENEQTGLSMDHLLIIDRDLRTLNDITSQDMYYQWNNRSTYVKPIQHSHPSTFSTSGLLGQAPIHPSTSDLLAHPDDYDVQLISLTDDNPKNKQTLDTFKDITQKFFLKKLEQFYYINGTKQEHLDLLDSILTFVEQFSGKNNDAYRLTQDLISSYDFYCPQERCEKFNLLASLLQSI
jgi:hypothetical protein